MRFVPSRRLAMVVLVLACLPGVGGAETPTNEPATGPYTPPTIRFEDGKIELLEAVRLTLEHDPNLLLQEEDVRFQEGLLQEIRGAFDWNLTGELSYQHHEQELRRSVFDREEERRTDLARIRDTSCERADRENQKIWELRAARRVDGGVRISADPALDAQLQVIEQLIASADDPVRIDELRQTRIDIIDVELAAAGEVHAAALQSCHEADEDLRRLGETPELEEFDDGYLRLGLDKLFRNGIGFSPFFDGSYEDTQYIGKRDGYYQPRLDAAGNQIIDEYGIPQRRFIDFGGKNVEALYTFKVGFQVNVPLLRGRGTEAAAAAETAAEVDLGASALVLEHAAAERILSTVAVYWNLLAAQQRLEILEQSVKLQTQLVEIARELIDADEIPRAELSRVLASEANARAQAQAGARDLLTARLVLAQTMGINVADDTNAPLATGPFPAPPAAEAIAGLASAELAAAAVGARRDLAAARALVDSGRILARAARIELRSRLDLGAGMWATALGESSVSEAVDRWVAPSFSLDLMYEKPLANNVRRGQMEQREAQLRQQQISAADLERNVRIGVLRALGSLVEARGRLERAEEAAQHFEKTIEAEMEKFRERDSTLVDTILTEQQRTGAQLTLLSARQEVAMLLAELRFETGTIVAEDAEGSQVTLAMLTALPGEQPGS